MHFILAFVSLRHSPKLHLRGGVGVNMYFTIYTYLSLLRLMHYLIILHYFIIYLVETLRSLHHLLSCHVDNTDFSTPHVAHVVNNTDLRAPPLLAYLHIIALNPVLNGG